MSIDRADDDKLASANDKDALLAEVRERFEISVGAHGENHAEAMDDLQFLRGNQWPANIKRERDIDARPCLTVNKLPTFVHQVTNDQRQNVPGIKVSPVDDNADIETAKVFQGLIRHIEYASNAEVAYDTAVNDAAKMGFGYFRLVTEYTDPKSFDQDIRFKRIRNAFTVYMDPGAQESDGSDQQWCLLTEKIAKHEFRRQWPDADVGNDSFVRQIGDGTTKDWVFSDSIRVAHYYRIEHEDEKLVMLPDGTTEWADVLDEQGVDYTGAKTRDSARKKVMLYLVTGCDVLQTTEIMCPWIPVFPVYGDELVIDGKVYLSGIVRNAKDPQAAYNFWITSATEEVALRPKVPYIGAAGQFDGFEDDWGQANTRSFPYLEYNQVTLEGVQAPAPQRQPMADMPVGAMQMLMHANDNIKATTGLFDSSLGALGSARSGVQERQQQRQGDTANFHFTDNLNRTVRHAGRCLVAMIPHYYDATRVVRVMGEDNALSHATINKPIPPEEQETDEQGRAVRTVLNDLTTGVYDIVVRSGPSYDTQRQEAVDNMVDLGGKWPKLMDAAGDLVVKSMDWPGAQEIAERLERTIPPEIRGDDEAQSATMIETPQGPIPKDQVGPMLAQMQQQMQMMEQALQEAQSGMAQAQVKADASVRQTEIDAASRERVAEINAVASNDVAELNGLVKMLLAQMQPPPQLIGDAFVQGKGASSNGAAGPALLPASGGPPEFPDDNPPPQAF